MCNLTQTLVRICYYWKTKHRKARDNTKLKLSMAMRILLLEKMFPAMNSDQGSFPSSNSSEILPTSPYTQGHAFFLSFFQEYFLCVSSQGPSFFSPSVTLQIFLLILGKKIIQKKSISGVVIKSVLNCTLVFKKLYQFQEFLDSFNL